jgi:hypothetical protein
MHSAVRAGARKEFDDSVSAREKEEEDMRVEQEKLYEVYKSILIFRRRNVSGSKS